MVKLWIHLLQPPLKRGILLPRQRVLPGPHPGGYPGVGLGEPRAGPACSSSAERLCLGASFFFFPSPLSFFFLRRRSGPTSRLLVSRTSTLVATEEGVSGEQERVAGGTEGQELFPQQQLRLVVVEEAVADSRAVRGTGYLHPFHLPTHAAPSSRSAPCHVTTAMSTRSSPHAAVSGGMERSLEESMKPPEVKFSLSILAHGCCSPALLLSFASRC